MIFRLILKSWAMWPAFLKTNVTLPGLAIDLVDSLNLDGKTLRCSASGGVPGVHLLAAYAPHVAGVVAQVRVDGKTVNRRGPTRADVLTRYTQRDRKGESDRPVGEC